MIVVWEEQLDHKILPWYQIIIVSAETATGVAVATPAVAVKLLTKLTGSQFIL